MFYFQYSIGMQLSNTFVILFIAGTLVSFLLNQWLEYYDFTFRKRHGAEVPQELSGYIDRDVVERTRLYEDAKYRYWVPESVVTLALDLFLVFSGFYPGLFTGLWSRFETVYGVALLFFIIAGIPSMVVSLLFSLYGEFCVEKKFGFSTMTLRLWIIDQLKSLLVSAVLGIPLMLIMIALLEHAAGWWWILLGSVYVIFSIGVSVLYPRVIAPLFNTFSPLPEGELKERLTLLLKKTGFKASGVYVMDASKRSNHSNAYFTGFGKSKRIVLYDTLVSQLTTDEIEAVLGHELGHYKKHHIVRRLAVSIPMLYLSLFVVSLFITHVCLYAGFGFKTDTAVFSHMQFIGIFLLGLVFSGYSWIYGLASNWASRRDEFEADCFSAALCGSGAPLASALIKLNKENLSELTPPAVYCLFNYSHPPLLERIRALK
jgi:STE24 endopeptidase